ncbi:hypothetical protein O1611_g8204 [Lasiodiplodia mahajangana]|uniref:Uncharacterized protein n=1 Tax=Lasiodiplodia mahajangana TaxID=1108764 RepID=A0ACC2JD83_9PEZI|nr:hypothetical protein O1611_g8204 [Lasiodiplodia mahajangana]
MISRKIFAIMSLVTSSVLASTPQGYGYGDMTDTIVGASTDSPASTDMPSSITPITMTESITLTRPATVTHTVTVSLPGCGSGKTTTIEGTTSTTMTTHSTIFISVSRSSRTSTETFPSIETSTVGFSTVTDSILTWSPTTSGPISGNTATTSCGSITTTDDVDGITGSSSGSPLSTLTLSATLNEETATVVASETAGSTVGSGGTHTSPSAVPYSTVPTSMGVQRIFGTWYLLGTMGLVSLVFSIAL